MLPVHTPPESIPTQSSNLSVSIIIEIQQQEYEASAIKHRKVVSAWMSLTEVMEAVKSVKFVISVVFIEVSAFYHTVF